MQFLETFMPGCYELRPRVLQDQRGKFIKTFHEGWLKEQGLATHFAEEYYSVSGKGVLRGLHFQTPPYEHVKLVYCVVGRVLDALVDLRVGSPTFGRHLLLELDAERANCLYVAAGVAHGFYTVSEQALMVYKVTTVYAPECDTGIRWDSVGIDWTDQQPILSERDSQLVPFDAFSSPFKFIAARKQK